LLKTVVYKAKATSMIVSSVTGVFITALTSYHCLMMLFCI